MRSACEALAITLGSRLHDDVHYAGMWHHRAQQPVETDHAGVPRVYVMMVMGEHTALMKARGCRYEPDATDGATHGFRWDADATSASLARRVAHAFASLRNFMCAPCPQPSKHKTRRGSAESTPYNLLS